jgi:hypothetical protein
MVQRGILNDSEITTIERFLNELKPIPKRYEMLRENWPFEIGRYITPYTVKGYTYSPKLYTYT